MKNQQDKFILFCRRLLSKEKFEKLLDWEFLTFLMQVQHAYFYLYKYCSENKIKAEKQMIDLLEELNNYFLLLEKAYYNKDLNSVHKINELKNSYHIGACLKLIEKSSGKNSVVYSYIRELFRLVQMSSSPVLAGLLEKEI